MADTPHMRLGDIANEAAADQPKPLAGIRVLAVEQMAALPFGTQLLARLGADVVKVESPAPEIRAAVRCRRSTTRTDAVGATFLRNNLNKRSVTLNLKDPDGVRLCLELAKTADIVCENFKAGTADRLGIGYDAVKAVNPAAIYLSVSGFGNDPASPHIHRAAYAAVVEGMSGIYEYKRLPERPPIVNPVGALGDISSALFGVIGVLAALRHRDATGEGQYVDIAMLDAAVAMTDLVTNFYSMGIAGEAESAVGIIETFAAGEGISSCSVCASTSSKSSPKSPVMVNGSPTTPCYEGRLARSLRHRDPPRRRALGRIDDQPRGGRHSCGRGSCRRRELHPGRHRGGRACGSPQHARRHGATRRW